MEVLSAFSTFWTPERAFFAYIIFMSFVQSLPDPDDSDSTWYVVFYKLCHAIAINTNVVRKDIKKGYK